MVASLSAILVNLVFNWLLIFGHFGFPALGVRGAAIATVLSRFVELAIITLTVHRRARLYPFIRRAWSSFRVPMVLVRNIAVKGLPLLVNEFFWSAGLAAILACYAQRGIDVVAACNIATTINNLFNVFFISMGNAVAIMVGQALGADEPEQARDLSWKLMAAAFVVSAMIGLFMFLLAPAIPMIYNTEQSVRDTAAGLLRILAAMMPFFSISHSCYFVLRSGGRTMITFFFDCVFTWAVNFGCAWCLVHLTAWPILPIYACVQGMEFIKDVVGIVLVKKGIWINRIVV